MANQYLWAMRVKVDDLVRKIALKIGETPATMAAATESEDTTLADRIKLEIELRATEAVIATFPGECSEWEPIDDEGLTDLEDGSAMLPLPEDFLRLCTLRLNGWKRNVTEVHMPDSPIAKLQGGRWAALRATPHRPIAVMEPCGNGRCLHLYGKHSDPVRLLEAWYLPAPRIDDEGYISLPAAAVRYLIQSADIINGG